MAYRVFMAAHSSGSSGSPGSSPPSDSFSTLIRRGLDRGLAAWEARAAAARAELDPAVRNEIARQEAIAARESIVRRHEVRIQGMKRRATVGAATAGAAGGLGILEVVTTGSSATGWFIVSLVAALLALKSRTRLRKIEPPVLPAVPPRYLPPGTIGHNEAEKLANVEAHLAQILPTVDRLHPEAGKELRDAGNEASPVLRAQVDRLAALDHLRQAMPGTRTARAAAQAAEQVRASLAEGVDAYDELLASTAVFLASPDPYVSASEALQPAIVSLQAYAHGMLVSSPYYTPEWGDLPDAQQDAITEALINPPSGAAGSAGGARTDSGGGALFTTTTVPTSADVFAPVSRGVDEDVFAPTSDLPAGSAFPTPTGQPTTDLSDPGAGRA